MYNQSTQPNNSSHLVEQSLHIFENNDEYQKFLKLREKVHKLSNDYTMHENIALAHCYMANADARLDMRPHYMWLSEDKFFVHSIVANAPHTTHYGGDYGVGHITFTGYNIIHLQNRLNTNLKKIDELTNRTSTTIYDDERRELSNIKDLMRRASNEFDPNEMVVLYTVN